MNTTCLILLFCFLRLLGIIDIAYSYEPKCDADAECRRIFDCGKHIEHIKKLYFTNSIRHRNFLLGPIQRLTCGFEGKIPKICCPLTDDAYNATKFTDNKIKMNLRNRSLSGNCGNFLWNRNLPPDGDPTNLYEFPWLALLQYQSPKGKRFGCGGVLISDRYVLTAAHCLHTGKKLEVTQHQLSLHPSLQLTSVRLGEYDLRNGQDCFRDDPKLSSHYCNDNSVELGIERQIPYDSYRHLRGPSDFNAQSHDIALLRLSQSVEFTDFIKPVCLPGRVPVKEGNYLAAGWAAVPDSEHLKSELKRMFRLNLTEKSDCDGIYGRVLQQDVICATAKLKNVGCIGDSGGPLMAVDKQSRMTVIGIYAPAGSGYCWTTSIPNTYTDVRQYYDWIVANLEL